MLWDWSGAYPLLMQYRVGWIGGRFGSGKTLQSVMMSAHLAELHGYETIANFNLMWGLKEFPNRQPLRLCIIIDEAGMETATRLGHLSEGLLAYLRKMEVVILLPSFIPPARKLQFLRYSTSLNLNPIGVDMAIYNWDVSLAGYKARGSYMVVGTKHYKRCYDSFSAQDQDKTEYILSELMERTSRFGNRKSKVNVSMEENLLDDIQFAIEDVSQGSLAGGKGKSK